MTEISFLNYFGGLNDFENLKKWLRVNADLYKDILAIAKERYELEQEYASRLSKLSSRLLKAFHQSKGSISTLWSNTAQRFNDESEIHRHFGTQIQDEFYKPLTIASDQFIKFKKPVEAEIDKCLRSLQEKKEDEMRNKKRAFSSMKECEKAFENLEEYKKNHPSSISGNDKERTKPILKTANWSLDGLTKISRSQIEKRALQLKEISSKSEKEYFESSLLVEDSRHNWEQSYILGLEQLQRFETDRLKCMKTVVESYHKSIDEIPNALKDLGSKFMADIQKANINDDLVENAMHYTNKSPNVYKTEQLLLNLYSESKENSMDLNRRIENIKNCISFLVMQQTKHDNLRTGALKMLTVYEDSPQFADDTTKKKTKREYSKTQSLVNLLSANIYKLLQALNNWQQKSPPSDPLTCVSMRIVNVVDRNSMLTSTLESKPGTMLQPYDPGLLSRSNSNNGGAFSSSVDMDDFDDFDTDSDDEPVTVQTKAAPVQSRGPTVTTKKPFTKTPSIKRPLPALPNARKESVNVPKCQALHDFVGRDAEELSFNEGDVITIKRKISDVWWEGEHKGKVGLIPRDYVKEL